MRAASLLVVFLAGLGGCEPERPAEGPPNNGPAPGPWSPQQTAYAEPPPQAPQGWAAPQPQPWMGPVPAPVAPPPQSAQPALPWPAGWVPQLPAPIALPAGWPGIPGLPGWPGAAPPAPGPVAPPGPVPVPPAGPPAQEGDVAQRCVDGINRYRAGKGLSPLGRWVDAEPCATNEAAEDAQSQRPHGSFGKCREMAQNACPNWPGPKERMVDDCLRQMWNEGPGELPAHVHYENMASPRHTQVACAVHTMPDGRLWSVQDFR